MKITDFKLTFKDIDTAMRATNMFELRKKISIAVFDGKFKEARRFQKELANVAVSDFETYKALPLLHFTAQGFPVKSFFELMFNSFKFNVFYKLSRKTPEEKQLSKLSKEYYGNLSKEDRLKKTIDITI